MHAGTLRALEFDRIVALVADLAVTPLGHDRLRELLPLTDAHAVLAAQRATSEGTKFLADHPGFPLRAPSDLETILDGLGVEGRALEPLRLFGLADYLESVEQTRGAILRVGPSFPVLSRLVAGIASFADEIADVRRKLDPSGEVADNASPALASIRERLRRQRQKLRTTLDTFLRGREHAKYLQEQVVTDRNGRYVLVVRAEHRSAIPGIVHGGSASGASLFVEPLETVEVNNEIVALEEQEAEEVRRILLALTDAFRVRADDLEPTIAVATELDAVQARARFSNRIGGVEPALAADGTLDLVAARHPLLVLKGHVVPVDVRFVPPIRVLVITGPNTGGKTVALKTTGLLAAMAQAGLHVPAEPGTRLPVFKSLFADIGDEQSIANSLSTFSAHIANVVSMDRDLELPALVLLDEVGAGTDPAEGGALGIAVIDHFRQRGAYLLATTHYDSLKSYASTTDGVVSAAFGFDPETFAPTYRLVYGSPGRSLAIEIAARLGLPPTVIAAARQNLSEREQQLADHLARVDDNLRRLADERRQVTSERLGMAEADRQLRAREDAVRGREDNFKRRLDARLDEHLRAARRDIDAVVDGLKAKAGEMGERAGRRLRTGEGGRLAGLTTGEIGGARADTRTALDAVVSRLKGDVDPDAATGDDARAASPLGPPPIEVGPGVRVAIGALGLEGTVIGISGKQAEVDVRGKRMRAPLADLRAVGGPSTASVRVNVDLLPREHSLSELNVIGCSVDEALTRLQKFLDESLVTGATELRIVHGHGTGQLRRAVAAALKDHPLVARVETAPQNKGGGGATVVTLKD